MGVVNDLDAAIVSGWPATTFFRAIIFAVSACAFEWWPRRSRNLSTSRVCELARSLLFVTKCTRLTRQLNIVSYFALMISIARGYLVRTVWTTLGYWRNRILEDRDKA
jgi:hypothetical protein